MAATEVDPFDQTAARAEYRRQARASDRAESQRMADAYDQGRADATADATPPKATKAPATAPNRAVAGATDAVSKPRSSLGGVSAGDVVIGALGYAILNAWLLGGLPMVRQWFAAKWLNRAPATPATPTSSTSSPRAAGQTSGR